MPTHVNDSKEPKPTAAKKTTTIKSKNKKWGFYGTYSRSDATKQYTVDQAWDAAVKAYINSGPDYTGAMARKYLDSSDGRHHADAVIDDIMIKGHSLDDAVNHKLKATDKPADAVVHAKDGYISLNGKMFGRTKKSLASKGDPTPWTVEVYRGTERVYVKGKTKKEAVDEALKQWGNVPMLYQGHKGPGVGVLKTDAPHRRDGDKDTVVAERRPRKSEKHPKSPIKLSDYGELKDAIQDYKQTISVPKGRKPSAEKQMGYKPAKKKLHSTAKAGRGGDLQASKK